MGTDTLVFVRKSQLSKLLREDWDDFIFLVNVAYWRWYRFEQNFDLEFENVKKITSKELVKRLAEMETKIKDRRKWVEILSKYDIVFCADTVYFKDKDYVEIFEFKEKMVGFVDDNLKEVIKFGK